MEVFHARGFTIIAKDTWKRRPEDAQWQARIIVALENSDIKVDPKDIEVMRQDIGVVRFRPEEIAGAAISVSESPMTFDQAVVLAEEILLDLRAGCGPHGARNGQQ